MEDNDKLEMVDRYIMGQMSSKEVEDFERLIAGDQEIGSLVSSQRQLIKGMDRYQEKVEFFDMLTAIKNEKSSQAPIVHLDQTTRSKEEENSQTKIRRLRFGMAYAAGFALLVTAILFMLESKVDTAALASNHFSFHGDLLSAQIAASGATDELNKSILPLLEVGIQSYNRQDYNLAKAKFQEFKDQLKARNYLAILCDFYLAQIALYENQPEETIRLLSPLQPERGLPIEGATKWYLALAYLTTHDKSNAEKLLRELQTDLEYGSRANEILAKL